MPVDFLNDDQAAAYGGEVEEAELLRYFFLDDDDRSHIDRRRRDSNRLGYAVQLCSVRALGRFLPDARDVPRGELRQRYKEGQEDQIGALGLVLNVVVRFNTRYLQAAVDELTRQGRRTTLAVRPSSREHSGALRLRAAGARRRAAHAQRS